MSAPLKFSAAAHRTGDSPISDLMARALAAPDLVSLAAGFVDFATLPVDPTRHAARGILSDALEGRRALQYGTTRGDARLRQLLVDRMVRQGELPANQADNVLHRMVVTTGSQQLLYLVAEALIDPGDIVLVESPTYFVFLSLLERFGARAIGVATDAGGMRIDAMEATFAELEARGELEKVKLVYTISEHSNPTGLSLAADRRGPLVEAVRAASKRGRILILEDAAYRGLTFEGAEPPSVWAHDLSGDVVIHARTFSKTFSPGLKTGYGVLPSALVDPILALKANHDFGSAHFNQQLLERVVESGAYDEQIGLLVSTYRRKRDALLAALDEHMGAIEGVSWTRPHGGLYVWVTFPEGIDTSRDGAFFAACIDEGVLYVPGALAFAAEPEAPPTRCARLSFGVASEASIAEGVQRLTAALARCRSLVVT